jgi:hypothetical protein
MSFFAEFRSIDRVTFPLAILAMYFFIIDRENTERLFTTVPGQIMLCAALNLNVVAYLWARAILNPEI